ncbi:MAG: DUF2254 domain-containing protein [Methanobrevibacter sp.]|nr:DUF2254 domain-containing protein [Methanobrevibacter sp.]
MKILNKVKILILISIVCIIAICKIYMMQLTPLNIDITVENNAINILTSIAEIQAGILAIIVSLTLVAVQISSQHFSPRLMSMFTGKINFWGTLFFYLFCIIIELILLWLSDFYPYKYEFILISIILMIISNVLLFLYIEYSIEILKPDRAIILIGEDIKNENVETFLLNEEKITKNPFIVLTDVIFNSINCKDQITLINGIDTFKSVFKSYIIYFIKKHGNLDMLEGSETTMKYIVSTSYFNGTIVEIFNKCIETQLLDACIYCCDILYDMYKIGSDNEGNSFITDFIDSLMIIDDKTELFAKKNYFNDRREYSKAFDLITRPLYQIGNIVALAAKYEENSVIIDASLIHLKKKCTYYFNNPKSEFKTFSDIYEPDHPFKSPIRLKYSIKSLLIINDALSDNFSDRYNLHTFEETVKFLGDCGKNCLRLDFRFLYQDIVDQLFDFYLKLVKSEINSFSSLEIFNSSISNAITYLPENKDKYINDFHVYREVIENRIVNLLIYCIKKDNDIYYGKISSLLFDFYNFVIGLNKNYPLISALTSFSQIFLECYKSCNLEILIITVKKLIIMIIENSLFGKSEWRYFINTTFKNLIYYMFKSYKHCKSEKIDNLLELLKKFSKEIKENVDNQDYINILMIETLQDKNFGLEKKIKYKSLKEELLSKPEQIELKEEDISKFKEMIEKYNSKE